MCGAAVCASVARSGLRHHCSKAEQAVKEDSGGKEEASPPRSSSAHASFWSHVVGTNRGNCGHSCEEHPDACGTAVPMDNVIVHIQKEQILIKDCLLGKGKMKEETALTVNWVSDDIDRWYVHVVVISVLPCSFKVFDDK
jgi:hypothetical protein